MNTIEETKSIKIYDYDEHILMQLNCAFIEIARFKTLAAF